MSHVFSSSPDNTANQRLTPEEVKELIRNHHTPEANFEGRVSVQDMAETLGVPTWQVQQMVQEMRSKNNPPSAQSPGTPMPSSKWIKSRLWIWAAISLGGMWLTGHGIGAAIQGISHIPAFTSFPHIPTPKIHIGGGRSTLHYDSEDLDMGDKLGLQAPRGFSYKIATGNTSAAIKGADDSYIHVSKLSEDNVDLLQKEFATDIADGFGKMVAKHPPTWVDGQAIALMELNSYPGGPPVSVDLTLDKDAFPISDSNPASHALKEQIMDKIDDTWEQVTKEEIPDED